MSLRPLSVFCLLQGALYCIGALGFFLWNGFFTDPIGLTFTFVFIVGHAGFLAVLLGLIGAAAGLTSPRVRPWVCWGAGSLTSFFLVADLVVFIQYRFHIDRSLLEMFFGPAGREIFVFPAGMWGLIALTALVIMAVEAGIVWLAKRTSLSNKILVILGGIWVACFLSYHGMYMWGKFKLVPSIISQQKILPLSYPLSANRRLEKWGFTPNSTPYLLPKQGSLHYPLAPLNCKDPSPSANVLILLVDSWRADMLNPSVMPRLSSWIEKLGVHQFTNHLSGGNSTAGGVFSLFYALPHSYWDDFSTEHLPPLLVSHALEKGYEPGIFASSKLTSPAFGRNVFATVPDLRMGSQGGSSWQRDENAVEDFEHFLQTHSSGRPFFGFIFLDAPHGYSYPNTAKKFTPAKEINYLLLTNRTDPTPYVNQYKNAVFFADELIDRVLTGLQKRGLLENTWVIITADHGQEFNDSHHNSWGHNGNFTDYQTKVPLLVYAAKHPAAAPHGYRTTHHDIAPTLLQEVYGCTNPSADYALGKNLFDPAPRPFTVFAGHTEKAIRIGDAITVFNELGGIKQYDSQLQPISQSPDPAALKEGLKAFRRFYK